MKDNKMDWEFNSHINLTHMGIRVEQAKYKDGFIYKIIKTRKSKISGWGTGKVTYEFKGKEYKNLEEIINHKS